ncbi:acyl carrier protein [Candidatus Pseudothioglobus singularis]|jgi:acyl carrier protein|nr:acyl carrier protein [Candidatus Pseudothioglobus singularis]MDB4822099.1 acyl carrier protein [Candidatus Pseudothioglobus singularis]
MKNKIIQIVSDIISINVDDLLNEPSNFKMGSPVSWDSLAHLAIMSELEDYSGKEISVQDMERMNSLDEIINFFVE